MSLAGKVIGEIEINAAAEKFYNIFKERAFNVPNISPKFIQAVCVHGSDWDSHGHGSIKSWNYTAGGKAEVFKERVEFDDEKLMVTLNGLEGDVFKSYRSFKPIYHVVPKGPNHSLARLIIEYEKLKEDVADPYKYVELMNGITKDIASHLNN